VQVTDSPRDQAVSGGLSLGQLPALDDLVRDGGLRAWQSPSWPGWQDAAWVALSVLGLAGIVVFERWEAVPFRLIELTEVPLMAAMFWVMTWHTRRRLAAGAEYLRVSDENERLLATQRQFLQDASHQLRTPITIALGHSELLARSLASHQDRRDIHVIVGELNRLRALSERLLLIATAENPEFLQPEPVALDELVTEIIRRWRPAADRTWQLGRLDAVTVRADRERLSLAIDALLENAVQYTQAGGLVRLSARGGEGRFAELTIEDGGTGMGPAELEGIFDRFATGPGRAGRRGTGLGLSLVRAVAAGHGGEVRVQSTPGAGSRFDLLLPLAGPADLGPGGRRRSNVDGG
jgi:signal transduction histidine kinase